jgi:hypothetical protein
MSSELFSVRGRVFFWIGLVVFPVFWIWWMTHEYFSRRQIKLARLWTFAYVLLIAFAWWFFPTLRERVLDLRWTYSHIAFQIGIVLWIWLIIRLHGPVTWGDIVGLIVCIDVIAIISGLPSLLDRMIPHPASAVFVLLPALAHLLVVPMERFSRWLLSHCREKWKSLLTK